MVSRATVERLISQVTVLSVIPEPDFVLSLLADPMFFVFLQVIVILLFLHLLVTTLENKFNYKLQDLKSNIAQLEKQIKELQGLIEKNKGETDSRIKDIEIKLAELHGKVDELEKMLLSRRTRKKDAQGG